MKMLINAGDTNVNSHVEFISYTGKWPNLCSGILTLKIDGRELKFGSSYHDKTVNHGRFWRSGGCCGRSIQKGEWKIDVAELPEEYRKYASEIDNVLNRNVEHGCCGGCR